jgi:hypothetical protein
MVKQPRSRDPAWHLTHGVGGMGSRLAGQGPYTPCAVPDGNARPPPDSRRLRGGNGFSPPPIRSCLREGAAAKNFTTTYGERDPGQQRAAEVAALHRRTRRNDMGREHVGGLASVQVPRGPRWAQIAISEWSSRRTRPGAVHSWRRNGALSSSAAGSSSSSSVSTEAAERAALRDRAAASPLSPLCSMHHSVHSGSSRSAGLA